MKSITLYQSKKEKMNVIIDIDNTCVSANERLKRCTKDGKIDWKCALSNEEVIKDPVIKDAPDDTRKITNLGIDIVYLTGREEICRIGTIRSLRKYHFPYCKKLIMRPKGDIREDQVIKEGQIKELKKALNFVGSADDDYNGKLGIMYERQGIRHFKTIKKLANYLEKLLENKKRRK